MARTADLTARQRNILDYIIEYQERHGYPPTIREIGEFFNIKSTNGVSDHLRALERKGYISRSGQQSRGLSILKGNEGSKRALTTTLAAAGESDLKNMANIPIVGRVAAGQPITAIENVDQHVRIEPALLGMGSGSTNDGVFGLRVVGRSMVGAGILPGDLVFVQRDQHPRDGRIVVAKIDGEATVKRLYRDGTALVLQPENPEMSAMRVEPSDARPCEILGVVIGVFRRLR